MRLADLRTDDRDGSLDLADLDPDPLVQLAAWASPQSQLLAGRAALTRAWSAAADRLPGTVPRPPHWGGYAVLPSALEFWQGRASRLHDRFRYERSDTGWTCGRLAP